MDSTPRLPLEVIERIIGHSSDHPQTLHHFSLTCRQLHPRALCLMVNRATLRQGFDCIFKFVDLLEAKPHLKPLVRSIVVDPTEFSPFPLLHILPRLSEIEFRGRIESSWDSSVTLHPSTLVCLQRFGTQIQTLHLSELSFPTCLSFARVLLAFKNLVHLSCTNVSIETPGGGAPLTVITQRLSEQMQLKALAVDYFSPLHGDTVPLFLFSPGLAPSTVENLKIAASTLSKLSRWPRLRCLVLRLRHGAIALAGVLRFLEESQDSVLREIVLGVEPATSIPAVLRHLSFDAANDGFRHVEMKELEHRLLRYSQVSVTWVSPPLRRAPFWAHELSKRFPVLSRRGAMALKSDPAFPPGHDGAIRALVVSLDSTWIASCSGDSTIILWDTNGNIAQQWVPHGYEPVWSLSFSPDGRYLISGTDEGKVIVWDLSTDPARQAAVLEGNSGGPITSCAWSPDGRFIAFGSPDETMCLWDAHTSRQLLVLDGQPLSEVPSLAFSPDGRFLVSSCSPGNYCIWDMERGTLRRYIQTELPQEYSPENSSPVARNTFTLGNSRLAAASCSNVIEIWDVCSEREGRLFALEHPRQVNDSSFSPDERLLVTAVADGTVAVWDAESGVKLSVLEGHRDGVMKVCFSPCGKYIASASWDETVRVWRIGDGSCMAVFSEHEKLVTHVAFTPDGKTLVSGARNGTVFLRDMHGILPIDERDI